MEVARLGAGSFFGEISLLTGEPRAATVTSVTETQVYEITKKVIAPVIEKQPEISMQFGRILAMRKQAADSHRHLTCVEKHEDELYYKQILGKIQRFFGLS